MGFMSGKRVLIVGLATERSIAHGIAASMRREGAELAFTYQNHFLSRAVRLRNSKLETRNSKRFMPPPKRAFRVSRSPPCVRSG